MPEIRIEELFERYRSAGDLDALAEVFDRTADQLLKVARHLARDEAQAEDLVQATFLAAIEHAERFDASRELVPWLVGILTNKAQIARAVASRAADPERLAERTSEDPAHDTEIREFMATLERALERVPDAYRQVLRIHLAEGKGAEAIAHEVKRPAGTVRVQLHRGLKALRRLLPAGFALGGIVVLTAPRGMAAVRASVLGRASVLAKAGVAGATGVTTAQVVGGVLVGKKIAAAAAILIVASGALWMAKHDSATVQQAPVVERSEPARLEASTGGDSTLADGAANAKRESAASPAVSAQSDPYGSLDMEWVWADGTPAAGIGVEATPMGDERRYDHSPLELTDEHGRLTFERVHEGKVYVISDRACASKSLETFVRAGHRTTERCTVPAGEDVRGRVLDSAGNPVSDASVWLMMAVGNEGGVVVARSGRDGSYFVRAVDPGCGLFATADRFGSSLVESIRELDPQTTGSVSLDLRLRGECGAIAGVVRDPDGKPIANAWVTVRFDPSFDKRDRVDWPAVWMATLADGSFRFTGCHKGAAAVEVTHTEFAVLVRPVRVEEGGTTQVDATLEHGFVVEGVLHAGDGSAIADAEVTQGSVPDAPHYSWQRQLYAKTDADGHYRLTRIPSGEIQLTVVSRTPKAVQRATTQLRGKSDDRLTWNPELNQFGKIAGRVVDESGQPLEGWSVEVGTRARIDFHPRSVKTDAQGRFELLDCADAPFLVAAYPPPSGPQHFRAPAEAQADGVRPGQGELLLTVTAASRSTAFMTGRILDEQDKPVEINQFWARNEITGQSAGAEPSKEDGSFRVGPMPSGKYTLSVTPKGRPSLTLDPIEIAPEEQRDLGVIRIRTLGKFEVVLSRDDGEKIRGAGALLFKGRYAVLLKSDDQVTFTTDEVYPGTYTLYPTGQNIATEQRQIEIASGETTRVEFHARAGVTQRIDFQAPEGANTSSELRIVVRGADGAVCLDYPGTLMSVEDGSRTARFFAGYAPGRYTFQASTKGWEANGSFEIAGTATAPPAIHVLLVPTR